MLLAFVDCPETGEALEVELPDDDRTLTVEWMSIVKFYCPVCATHHQMSYKSIYLRGLPEERRTLPVDLQCPTVH